MNACGSCGHARIRHVQDGLRWDCLTCLHLAMNETSGKVYTICHARFNFNLSEAEREQAANANKESWPPTQKCGSCFGEWQEHMGYLCPSGDSTFVPLLDSSLPFLHIK